MSNAYVDIAVGYPRNIRRSVSSKNIVYVIVYAYLHALARRTYTLSLSPSLPQYKLSHTSTHYVIIQIVNKAKDILHSHNPVCDTTTTE